MSVYMNRSMSCVAYFEDGVIPKEKTTRCFRKWNICGVDVCSKRFCDVLGISEHVLAEVKKDVWEGEMGMIQEGEFPVLGNPVAGQLNSHWSITPYLSPEFRRHAAGGKMGLIHAG